MVLTGIALVNDDQRRVVYDTKNEMEEVAQYPTEVVGSTGLTITALLRAVDFK